MRGRGAVTLAVLLGTTFVASLQIAAQNQTQTPTHNQQQAQPSPSSEGDEGRAAPAAPVQGPPPDAAQPPPAHGQQGATESGYIAPFPAQQRPLAPPDVLARGKAMFASMCGACHGADARGGQLGGVNLLRSKLVLGDRDGELVMPVVKQGRPGTAMQAIPLPDDDIKAIVAYIHSLQAATDRQGGPPPGEDVELNILVGDAKAGAAYFDTTCSACHSTSGDLAGIASRYADPKLLQNAWVSGGRAVEGEGRRPPRPGQVVTAKVILPHEVVEGPLVRLDDFLVTVAMPDGTTRTVRRDGETPKVEVHDPLARHDELLGIMTDKNVHDVTAYLATVK